MHLAIQPIASGVIYRPELEFLGEGRRTARFAANFMALRPSRIEPLDRAVHDALTSCQEKYDRKHQAPELVNCAARVINTMVTKVCLGAPQITDCMVAAQREQRLWADEFSAASGFDAKHERAGDYPAGITKNEVLRANREEYHNSGKPAQRHSQLMAFLEKAVPPGNRGSAEEIVRSINELHKIKWEDQVRMTEAGKLQDRKALLRRQYTTRPATINGHAYTQAKDHLSRKLDYFLQGENHQFVERVAQARLKHFAARLADETQAARAPTSGD